MRKLISLCYLLYVDVFSETWYIVLDDIHAPNAKNRPAFTSKLIEILMNVYQEDNVFVHMFLSNLWACTKVQWDLNGYPIILTKF